MQTFILIGAKEKQQGYLASFQKSEGIPSYLVNSFEEFKIADARALQKTLSLKLKQTEKRLIIISSPTPEAQNALLKSVEELPDGNLLFFLASSPDDLLSTIVSRCKVIRLEAESQRGKESEQNIGNILNKPEITLEDIEEAVILQRQVLLDKIKVNMDPLGDTKKLKNLHKNYKLAKNNNINKRLALDAALS